MKSIITILCVMLSITLNASELNWGWATQFKDGSVTLNNQAIDAAGNTYLACELDGSITADDKTATAVDGTDVLVAKYDNSGKCLWLLTAGSDFNDGAQAISVSPKGSVFVAGYISGPATFGKITIQSEELNNKEVFVAKISSQGTWEWVETYKGKLDDIVYGVVADSKDNIYLAGEYQEEIVFGNDTLSISDETPAFFMTRLNSKGVPQWAKSFGKSGDGYINALTLNHKEQPAIAGNFGGDLVIDNEIILLQGEDWDGFVCQMDDTGYALWAKTLRGTGTDSVNGMVSDKTGNLYLVGNFVDSIMLDKEQTGGGEADIFVTMIDPNGNWKWSNTCGGTGGDYGQCIAISKDGILFMGGEYNVEAYVGQVTLSGQNDQEPFVAELDAQGRWVYAIGASGVDDESIKYMSIDSQGNAIVSGMFTSLLNIGPVTLDAEQGGDYSAQGCFLGKVVRKK